MATAESLVVLSSVRFAYRKRMSFFRHKRYLALNDLDFEIYRGETVGVIGENGCGKSTLLKLIGGIFDPDQGRIDRGGASVSLLAPGVGFDPELSGKDNILLSGMLLGASRRDIEERYADIVAFSELHSMVEEPLKVYSTGMKLRLGFSVAAMLRPDVVLIDEALSAGDVHFRQKAENELLGKAKSRQTVVIVSHNNAQIRRLCDRVVWLRNGRVGLSGAPDTVVKHYEEFVTHAYG